MKKYDVKNEQESLFRRFVERHGKIIFPISLLLIAFLAWAFFQKNNTSSTSNISENYEKWQMNVKNKTEPLKDDAENFADKNANAYGVMASLELAKKYVEQGELDKAALRLEKALKIINDSRLAAIINLRLARIQAQQKKMDEALKTLDRIKDQSWAVVVADVRGDILIDKGDKQGAKSAWQSGMMAGTSPALQEILQMKINNLG